MILIIITHNHLVHEVDFTIGDHCLFKGDVNIVTIRILIGFIVCIHSMGVLIIIVLSFLLYTAYKTQKAVGQDTKNLFRIALGIVVAFGMAWIVYAFQPLYSPVAPLVFYSTAAIQNIAVISVFFYNNEILTKAKMCFVNIIHHNHETVTVDIENV